jgi:non-specific serine/threonine protein kinase
MNDAPLSRADERAELVRSLGRAWQALDEAAAVGEWMARRLLALEQAIELVLGQAAPGLSDPCDLWGELTPREREVAQLVARGWTNRRIAQTLVVGEKTVETHVGHILDKFGYASRAQIIARAQAAHIRGVALGYP